MFLNFELFDYKMVVNTSMFIVQEKQEEEVAGLHNCANDSLHSY